MNIYNNTTTLVCLFVLVLTGCNFEITGKQKTQEQKNSCEELDSMECEETGKIIGKSCILDVTSNKCIEDMSTSTDRPHLLAVGRKLFLRH